MSSAGGWWRRIAFSVVVALMALLGFAGPGYAEPVPTPAPAQIYSYDGAPECAVLTADGSERGPPRTRDEVAYDAVGLWSRGASACSSDGPTPPGVSTYDDPAPLVEVVRAAGTPPQRDRALVADLSSTTPGGVAANAAVRLADSGVVNPATIRFSQSSISGSFRGGGSVKDLAAGLRNGTVNPGDVPAIRLVERNGNYFTLDNRRLAAFQEAGVDVPYRMATPQEIASQGWKFTTTNDGTSIIVRGGG